MENSITLLQYCPQIKAYVTSEGYNNPHPFHPSTHQSATAMVLQLQEP